MARRGWRCICALLLAVSLAGCAGSTDQGAGPAPSADLSRATKPVVMVGFDAERIAGRGLAIGEGARVSGPESVAHGRAEC